MSTDGFTPAQLEQLRQIVREEMAVALGEARQFESAQAHAAAKAAGERLAKHVEDCHARGVRPW